MKKHLSVFMLFVRSTIYKVLGILVLMCGLEFLLFNRAMTRAQSEGMPGLEWVVEKSWMIFVFLAAVLCIFAILTSDISRKKSKTQYTLSRLRINEHCMFFWQAASHMSIFAFAFAVQTIFAFMLCQYYVQTSGDATITQHTIFLAFYRSDFLHSLVPFDEMASIAGNFVVVFTLGLSSALASFTARYNKGSFSGFIGGYTSLCFMRRGTGDFGNNLLIFILAAVVIAYAIYFLFIKEARHDK